LANKDLLIERERPCSVARQGLYSIPFEITCTQVGNKKITANDHEAKQLLLICLSSS
jgi:hypothetical protein